MARRLKLISGVFGPVRERLQCEVLSAHEVVSVLHTALVGGKRGKQELVAVNVELALLLAFHLVVQVKGGSDNV